ncbi:MAG: pyridoxal-phosphate dependent enzyme [Sphaerochaetaceae bacterium]|nr:pyridoxal-phosphate dependent enzyme [Spirochaetales bacterium]MDY5967943.1 pyridoxal-phosphate dependent enzyme [Sphaerochaetaceae bacterium]
MKFKYVCNDCGKEFVTDKVIYTCPECSKKNNDKEFRYGNLNVELDEKDLSVLKNKAHVTPEDFFVYPVPHKDAYPVGGTPIARPLSLSKKTGLKNLFFKLDSQLPSGSFKDRASQFVAAQALALGENKIALASTGNAGAAMCCAGAAYGLEIILFVPQTAPINKLMQSVLYGATVVPVKGTYDDAFALSIVYTENFGGINRNTAYNPMTIEGKKSVSIELFEQLGRKVPDVFYVPVGDGCIISGVAKGFYDLKKAGLIDKLPHLVAAQSEESAAISNAFNTGKFLNIDKATTRADSISVESPAAGRTAVKRLKECDGWATVVKDKDILEAQLTLAKNAGVFVEPAAATAYAALEKDASMLVEKFGEDVNVGVLLTGTAFKDMAVFEGKASVPAAIENSKEAVIKRFSK